MQCFYGYIRLIIFFIFCKPVQNFPKIFSVIFGGISHNLSPEMEEILNSPITADEINSVVQKLKNAGSDNILNEYIKYTLDDMLAIYVLLFNVILDKGIIPSSIGSWV
jgi:hypothetical protein